jgi:hypothetical protein
MTIARHRACTAALLTLSLAALPCSAGIPTLSKIIKKDKDAEPTPLDRYIEDALRNSRGSAEPVSSPGSIWTPASRLTDLAPLPDGGMTDFRMRAAIPHYCTTPA